MYQYLFYKSSDINATKIEELLSDIMDKHKIQFKIINIDKLSTDERKALIESIRELSRKNGVGVVSKGSGPLPISRSKKLSGTGFLLRTKNGKPDSVYPHEKNGKRIECIYHLNRLLNSDDISELKNEESLTEADISRMITSYPGIIEKNLIFMDTEVEVEGGRIDAVFADNEDRHLLIEIEIEAKDNAIGQVMRFRKPYSEKMNIPQSSIRLGIVCAEIGKSRIEACRSAGIEVYKIGLEKLA